jgi:hypothetical protein
MLRWRGAGTRIPPYDLCEHSGLSGNDRAASGSANITPRLQRCLAAGSIESELMPLDETVALASTLDAIRAQIGVAFPDD